MKILFCVVWQVSLFVLSCFTILSTGCLVYADELNVPFTVRNTLDINRSVEPVTTGIPLPADSGIFDTRHLGITDSSGNSVPASFKVTARWGGAPDDGSKPVKWLLATFMATVPGNGHATYHLVNTQGQQADGSLKVTENTSDSMTIDTGAATFTLDKHRFSIFRKVEVAGSVVTDSGANGLFLTDKDGGVYSTLALAPRVFEVEESGPARLVLKVEGSFADSSSIPLLDYRAYIYFYQGKSYARVLFTLGNHNKAKVGASGKYDVYEYYGANSVTFRDLSARVILTASDAPHFIFHGNASEKSGSLDGRLVIYQDSSGTDFWANYTSADNPRPTSYSRFRGYQASLDGLKIDSGDKNEGWVDCSFEEHGMAAGLVNFWQEFPKALSADSNGTVEIKLFPDEYSGLYNFRVGEEKTTEFFLYFHKADGRTAGSAAVSKALLHPMPAMAQFAWYQASRAIQETAQAEDPELLYNRLYNDLQGDFFKLTMPEMYDYYNDRTIMEDPRYNGPYSTYYPFHSLWKSSERSPSSRDYFNFFGSLGCGYGNLPLDYESYADGKAGPFDSKYDIDYGAWLQFLRKGDPDWFEMAMAISKYSEQLMLNDVVTETGWDVERWRNAVFGHAEHNETGNPNGQRNYLGPVLDTSFGAPGALLSYYLTGYPMSRSFLAKLAEYTYAFYMQDGIPRYTRGGAYENFIGRQITAGGPEGVNPPIREFANVINHLTAGFLLTGDKKYQELAQGLIEYYEPDPEKDGWQWLNGPDASQESTLYINEWNLVMYLHALGGYISALGEFGLSSEQQKATAIFMRFINWMKDYGLGEFDPADYRQYTYTGIYYPYWYLDGHTPAEDVLICNWEYATADVFAYAYKYTRDINYLELARRLFFNATMNQGYPGDTLTYMTAKEAANAAVFGHVYLCYAESADLPPDPPTNQPPVAAAGQDLTVEEGDTVVLDGSSSYDPDGDSLQFAWAQDADDPVQVSLEDAHTARARFTAPEIPQGSSLTLHFNLTVSDGIHAGVNDSVKVYVKKGEEPPPDGPVTLFLQQGVPVASDSPYQGTTDAYIRIDAPGNFGGSNELIVYNSDIPAWRYLLRFDLSGLGIPDGAEIRSAVLHLTRKKQSYGSSRRNLYRLVRGWVEGSGTYGNTNDGVSWQTCDGVNPWNHPGGDFDDTPVAISQETEPTETMDIESYDITGLVRGWLDGTIENYGILVAIPADYTYSAAFYCSSQAQDVSCRPALEIIYAVPATEEQNLVHNPGFDQGLQEWNRTWAQGAVEMDGDNNPVFVLEDGHLVQDIDLSGYADKIASGEARLVISSEMKTVDIEATDGHPYIRCLLFGTEEDTEVINAYVNTDYVTSGTWQKVTKVVSIPPHTGRLRLFLERTHYNNSESTSERAYFDNISVTIE